MILRDLIKVLDGLFNKSLALPNDPVGIQIGKLENNINKAVITLDITDDVVEETVKEKADLIIAHHPLIFNPVTDLLNSEPLGRKLLEIIEHNISVYIAHTNFDAMPDGLNQGIVESIGLKNIKILDNQFTGTGLARSGALIPPLKLAGFMKKLKKSLGLEGFRWYASYKQDCSQILIKNVAVINGSANSFMDNFSINEFDCDLIIVGELKYNKVLEIVQSGKIIIELGHGESEKMSINLMYDKLNANLKHLQGLKLIKSKYGFIGWRFYID